MKKNSIVQRIETMDDYTVHARIENIPVPSNQSLDRSIDITDMSRHLNFVAILTASIRCTQALFDQ